MYALWQAINDAVKGDTATGKENLAHSIGVVCNGGGITVAEVVLSILQGRQLFVLANTGRTADMLASLVDPQYTSPLSQEQEKLKEQFLSAMREQNIAEETWKAQLTIVALEPGQGEELGKLSDAVKEYLMQSRQIVVEAPQTSLAE